MSRRTYSPNALEPVLASSMTGGSTTVALDSAAGLIAPGYMVIDPDDVSKREFFKFESINSNTLEDLSRGLTGSAGGAVAHDAGAVVRTVMTSQAFDDLFLDIIDLETDQHTEYLDSDAVAAVATADDYVKNDGDVMTGLLTLSDAPSADLHAATKLSSETYTDGEITTHVHSEVFIFGEVGEATVKTGTQRLYLQYGIQILEVEISVGVAPTDDSLIVDVNVNGTTIFTTPSNRPQIAASGFVDSTTTIEDDTHTDGQYLTVDIDQIGSTLPGEDVTVVIRYEKT